MLLFILLLSFSAGGLATYFHADHFRSRIPSNIPVHVLADGGYVLSCVHVIYRHIHTHRISQVNHNKLP